MDENKELEVRTVGDEKTSTDCKKIDPLLCHSNIVRPSVDEKNYEIELGIIELIRQDTFEGDIEREDPYDHLTSFLEICDTFKYGNVPDETIRLRLFPFSLSKNAKVWLRNQPSNVFTSWTSLSDAFLAKYFPVWKTLELQHNIACFAQGDDETLSDAWERYKEMQRKCPNHDFPRSSVLLFFYQGLRDWVRIMINVAAHGSLMDKTPDDAFALLEKMAANSVWDKSSNDGKATALYKIEDINKLHAEKDALTKKLEAFNIGTSNEQQYNSYHETYNSGWRNSDFSLGGQGNVLHGNSQVNTSWKNQGVSDIGSEQSYLPNFQQERIQGVVTQESIQSAGWEQAIQMFSSEFCSKMGKLESKIEALARTTKNIEYQIGGIANAVYGWEADGAMQGNQ
ncbi:uncharacterized protein LOC141684840 [Apium graveolens]|uniref:uncharacterized protein LOC141684840 n=1 Tax=Apium graveolens TaxID=4045 RepID=UPI003D7AE1A1